jgi:hypothetical protein
VNFPTPGSSWPGQGRTPAPTAPPRQARAREINTRNDRPRDGHRSLADDYRRTHIPPPGTNAHDIIQGYFVDVIAQVIRLRLNAHGNLDHAGRVQSRTKPSGGPAFVASRAVSRCSPTEPASRPRLGAGGAAKSLPVQNRKAFVASRAVSRCSPTEPASRPRLGAGGAAKSLPVQNRKAPRQLSVHRNLGTDPRPARLLRGRPQAAPARASGARRARRANPGFPVETPTKGAATSHSGRASSRRRLETPMHCSVRPGRARGRSR